MSIHIPARGGVTTWFNGDILTTKLTAGQTSGALGLVEATCPPGGGRRRTFTRIPMRPFT